MSQAVSKNKVFLICIIGCFFLAMVNVGMIFADEDTKPVKKLRELYKNDKDFRKNLDKAFKNMHPQPDGSDNPWKDKGFEYLCNYFNEWYYFLPESTTGFKYIEKFTWFYYKNKYGQKFVRENPGWDWTKYFVTERGKYLDSKESTGTIKQWMDDPNSHMEDFVIPPKGFKSFNEFFTRTLKPGVRPIAAPTDDSVVAAPADIVVNMINSQLTLDQKIPVKGRLMLNIKELLDNSKTAKHFEGGTAVSCILLPTTYHHFHAPVSGLMMESKENVPGWYYGIPDFPIFFNEGNVGYNASFSVFEHFHRGYYVIKTQKFGFVGMVPVGLNTVGSVIFEEKFKNVIPQKPVTVYKGDRLGHFAYGGSLVILLFEPGHFEAVKLLQGQRMGILEKPDKEKKGITHRIAR